MTELEAALDRVGSSTGAEETTRVWLDALAGVGKESMRLRRSLNRISAAAGLPAGAKGRLLTVLKLHVREPLGGAQLGAVAGIGEWARRIRELRAEGYRIDSTETSETLQPGEYRLVAEEPDTTLRNQWEIAAMTRRLRLPASERLLRFLEATAGQKVTEDQLRHVTRSNRVRRLIQQAKQSGHKIESQLDASDLGRGEYRLQQQGGIT